MLNLPDLTTAPGRARALRRELHLDGDYPTEALAAAVRAHLEGVDIRPDRGLVPPEWQGFAGYMDGRGVILTPPAEDAHKAAWSLLGFAGRFLYAPVDVADLRALAGDRERLQKALQKAKAWGQTFAGFFAYPRFMARGTSYAAGVEDRKGAKITGRPTLADAERLISQYADVIEVRPSPTERAGVWLTSRRISRDNRLRLRVPNGGEERAHALVWGVGCYLVEQLELLDRPPVETPQEHDAANNALAECYVAGWYGEPCPEGRSC